MNLMYPLLLREFPCKEPDRDRSKEANEEEPVHPGVYTFTCEHPSRTDDSPNDRRVVEHYIPRASPRTTLWEHICVTDVLD
ncbi:hypothetical protein AXX17_AT4G30700 [Arabidopsis thaliana]|uniref:Uncharacterized protein n=1 Tax=Arabidopsis thaliana TaxID=3702 RepID=A0A178V3Y0_ARATH|nr:hypothetical protein AXX17_AT4G30700 [Arabidopsis thaliana]